MIRSLGVTVLLLQACAVQQPRWTPETVAPPVSTPADLQPPEPLDKRAEPLQVPASVDPNTPIPLTRDGAILTALTNNRAIAVARFGPQIGATYVPEARAAFDPVLMGTVSTGHDTRQLASSAASSSAVSSSSALTAGGSLAGQGAAVTAAPGTPDAITQALAQVQQLAASGQPPQQSILKTHATSGSLTVQELLPTGAQVFLTGGVTASETNLTGDDYQGNWTLGVTQSLLRGAGASVNLVALKQAKNRAAQSEHAMRQTVLDVTRQVELAYWDLVLAKEVLKIREFAVRLADEQLRRDQDWLAVGKAIEGDVMASQAEKASRTADLTDAQAAVRTQTLTLIRLMNPDEAQRWQLAFDPIDKAEVVHIDVGPDASEQLSLQYRPELAQARLDLANLDLDVTRTKNDLLPRVDLVGSYGKTSRGDLAGDATRYLGDSDFENYQIGVQVQTPILYRAEKARHRRAVLTSAQAERSVANLELSVATAVRQAAVETARQWERISATQQALRSRTEQLRVAQGRNAVGKMTNLDLLLVQRDFIQAQIDDVSARVKYIQALTSLYASEGTLLERRGIALDTKQAEKPES